MIVCHCNVVTDAEIRSTLADEDPTKPRSPAQAYRCLGCSPDCGRCLVTVRRILSDARASACPVGCAICPAAAHDHHGHDHHGHDHREPAAPRDIARHEIRQRAPVRLIAAE
ncbi:(2Fe-2S)-binding protein [Chelatococcus asaccharovorans]|uniref:(2Fe-2S)-binding protein n=1 Tax=Chelatococcus asaccharovorans TaxID=28210 RepID=UPI00224C65EF|nr:(2Fe-2S)-binding protein [Chelatococcus asaccharovorans]CAH1654269.1 Bacterioferritin-associated ferredoxin [Chelatococcus asaccharovorans]CAH1685795.1 Bacterioferritin-associated ferredoxin [Chelatococcus asaccharovorans]